MSNNDPRPEPRPVPVCLTPVTTRAQASAGNESDCASHPRTGPPKRSSVRWSGPGTFTSHERRTSRRGPLGSTTVPDARIP